MELFKLKKQYFDSKYGQKWLKKWPKRQKMAKMANMTTESNSTAKSILENGPRGDFWWKCSFWKISSILSYPWRSVHWVILVYIIPNQGQAGKIKSEIPWKLPKFSWFFCFLSRCDDQCRLDGYIHAIEGSWRKTEKKCEISNDNAKTISYYPPVRKKLEKLNCILT